MRVHLIKAGALALLHLSLVAYGRGEHVQAAAGIHWGKAVNGLQLGISTPVPAGKNKLAVYDGNYLCVSVHLRNVSDAPIRVLPSSYDCLAMGTGGAILATELILQQDQGGDSLRATYRGPNHLLLRDKQRPESESWQETLGKSKRGESDVQLDEKDAKAFSIVLAPGEDDMNGYVCLAPRKDSKSQWQLTDLKKSFQAGHYQVSAVWVVDHKLSDWKGKLVSGPLEVDMRRHDKKRKAVQKKNEPLKRDNSVALKNLETDLKQAGIAMEKASLQTWLRRITGLDQDGVDDETWIRRLGAPKLAERRAAQQALEARMPMKRLREATRDADPERAERARKILGNFPEHRQTAHKALNAIAAPSGSISSYWFHPRSPRSRRPPRN